MNTEQITLEMEPGHATGADQHETAAEREQIQAEQAQERRAQLEQEKNRYKVELRVIGREEALALSRYNKYNRITSKAHVTKLAQFQLDGAWVFNGTSIVLNGADEHGFGQVLEGHHRLAGVITSGIPQLFVIVSGVDPECFETYDIYNKSRATGDMFFTRGEQNPKVLAEALSWLTPRVATPPDAKKPEERWTKRNVLHLHRKAVLAEYPGIRAFANKYAAVKCGIPKGLLATLEYIMACRDAAQAATFMGQVVEATGLEETDPAHVFRQWFVRLKGRRTKKVNCQIADAVTVAWNAFRNGETITAIRVPNARLGFE